MSTSPHAAGYRQPAEWAAHDACWVAWPSEPALWPELAIVQTSFARMCRAIAHEQGERLEVLVRDRVVQAEAERALAGVNARFHVMAFGDIWMRDIAPVFLTNARGERASVRFRFNGWGDKYVYQGDESVAERVQVLSGLPAFASELVCEGGAVESDGAGLCMTTREVVLNPNRNPGLTQAAAEHALLAALGAQRVVWLERGLLNDHTDGHIDNIARFIGPGRVLCMQAAGTDDPNAEVLAEIEHSLRAEGLELASVPSPGLVLGRDGRPLPASYLNFYIANRSVVVPTFGSRQDESALTAFEALFPGRAVHAVPAKILLEEGGTVHCITQQVPSGPQPV